jgi:putative transposase
MPQSFFQIGVHLIFSTKNRLRYLDSDVIDATHAYLATVLRDKGCGQVVAGGTEDHVHVFCTLPKGEEPIKLIQVVKQESSKWIKNSYRGFDEFAWQRGYGIFSVSPQYFDEVIGYVNNQAKHHEKLSFQDEYRMFLKKYNMEYDEAYVWD